MEFWLFYRIIRKRRWLIVLGMVICVGLVLISNLRTKPLYTGRVELMESLGMSKSSIQLFNPDYMGQIDIQLRLSNLGRLATSPRVIEDAVATLQDLGTVIPAEEILASTSVQPVRDTNILAIEVTLLNQEDAKNAANIMAQSFRKAYAEFNNEALRQSKEFIEGQMKSIREEMVQKQDKLKQFKQENEIVEINQQSMAIVQRLAQAKTQLNGVDAQYDSAKARQENIKKELEKLPEWQTVGIQTAKNPIWSNLQLRLADLETAKAGMLNGVAGQPRRGQNHPDVLNLQRQIDDTNSQMKNVKQDYMASKNESRNALFDNTLGSWISAKSDEVAAYAQKAAFENLADEIRSEMSSLPSKQARLAELQTDVDAATQTYQVMSNKLNEAKIKEQQGYSENTLKIVAEARSQIVDQRETLKLIIALLLSPILGIGVALLLHYTDNNIRTASSLEKALGIPVLAEVPISKAHSLVKQNCPEVFEVSYQMLTSSLWIASQNQGVNSFAVISAEPNTGRSITASNIAVSLAKEGARVVLVDADLRQPNLHQIFGVENKLGLTNLLGGAATLEDVLFPTKTQGLLLVTSGPIPDNPVKLLKSPEMKEFIDQVKEVADFVIFDTPSGIAFPDPVMIAANVGYALIIQAAGKILRGSEIELNEKLTNVNVKLLGTVLNKVRREDSSGYFHYHRSYSGVPVSTAPLRQQKNKR